MNVIEEDDDPNYIKMSMQLSDEKTGSVNALVRNFRDVFAWSYEILNNEIPIDIVSHNIILIHEAKLVRQRQRLQYLNFNCWQEKNIYIYI